jgi:hypothetical protein
MTRHDLYVACAVVLVVWAALLWIAGAFGLNREPARERMRSIALGVVAVGLSLLPLGEFTLWRWVMSAHANPSVVLVGFLAAYVGSRLSGRGWISLSERRTAYGLGFAIGLVLYVSATGFLGADLYAVAWESRALVVATGLLAAVLILCGNRIGILLLVALVAYVGDLLESENFWDYLIDPVFWFLSVSALAHGGVRRLRRDRASAGAGEEATVGANGRQDFARN